MFILFFLIFTFDCKFYYFVYLFSCNLFILSNEIIKLSFYFFHKF